LLAERVFAACAKRAYTGGMRTAWKKIRYRLEWLALESATKFLPLLSRKACYGMALLLGSLGAMRDNLIVKGHAQITQRNAPDPAPCALAYDMGVRL
jgi:hypothetical protein